MKYFLLIPFTLGACAHEPQPPTIVTEVVQQEIPIRPRPRPLNLRPLHFDVVTPQNIEEYLESVSVGDSYVFVAMTVDTYERLSLNVNELRRYIEQQQSLLVYYEGFGDG